MADDDLDDFIDPEILRKHLREETELQVGTDGRDKLVAHLETITFAIWNQAAILADEAEDRRITDEHVGEAFGDLVKHHDEIGNAANEVRDLYMRLQEIEQQTPLYVQYEGDSDE
ncbi:hypothetical protein [Halorhabdus sp. CUG00001]|uniref:hypothetical protein n=1 Tax=Halorhabdus sp. CUG00001 TaxID=2600297 RepID=UPI00131ACF7D|nr:hypothetical protein [Halorhabdus sp. CUG00001]